MRICITGVAGFIGSNLADRLIAEGHDVHGQDNFETGKQANLHPDLDFVETDIADQWFPFKLDVDLIIHCAASYKDPTDWITDVDTNILGAQAVAEQAMISDARIFYFQTVLPPISSYAISKIAGEHYLRLSGQPLTVFRLAGIYGPRNLSGAIPTFYRQIKNEEICTVVEDATRDFVFIEDLVERVMGRVNPTHGPAITVDVRTGVETPIQHIPGMIGEILDTQPLVRLVPRREDDVQHYEMTGVPRVGTPFKEGLRKTVVWYEEHGVGETYTHLKINA